MNLPRREQLEATLRDLHEQLATADSVAPRDRQLLTRIMDDIRRLLADEQSGSDAQAEHQSLVDRLGDAARQFEDDHPTLSGTLGSVIDALSRMGI